MQQAEPYEPPRLSPGTPRIDQSDARPRVLLVDDQVGIRRAVEELLAGEGMTVVGTLPDGREVEQVVRRERPDVVVTDLRMPGGPDGIQVARRVRRVDPAVGVVLFTGAITPGTSLHDAAMDAGVCTVVGKGDPPAQLSLAVLHAAAGCRRKRGRSVSDH